jgi:hypothetical protein
MKGYQINKTFLDWLFKSVAPRHLSRNIRAFRRKNGSVEEPEKSPNSVVLSSLFW